MSAPLIWVLRDNRPGTAAQALGVAEAYGRPFVEQPLSYHGLARLPNFVRGSSLVGLDDASRGKADQVPDESNPPPHRAWKS